MVKVGGTRSVEDNAHPPRARGDERRINAERWGIHRTAERCDEKEEGSGVTREEKSGSRNTLPKV